MPSFLVTGQPAALFGGSRLLAGASGPGRGVRAGRGRAMRCAGRDAAPGGGGASRARGDRRSAVRAGLVRRGAAAAGVGRPLASDAHWPGGSVRRPGRLTQVLRVARP